MDRLPVAMVSIYTYVNPIIAVLLGGCSIARRLDGASVAMLIIFAGWRW